MNIEQAMTNPEARFKGVLTEMYRGHKLSARKGKAYGTIVLGINSWRCTVTAVTNEQVVAQLQSLRGYVDSAIEDPASWHDGYGTYVFA
jgi:hypothetical protein